MHANAQNAEVKKNDEPKDVVEVVENVEETYWEAVLPSSWGSSLPAPTPSTPKLTPSWRPWEAKAKLTWPWKPGPGRGKRRSPAAEARSRRRLLEWQHRVDCLREVNRLQSEQRIVSTPVPAPQVVRRVRLKERLDRVKGIESGSQTLPSIRFQSEGHEGELPGSVGEEQGLQASGFKNFSSLQQTPTISLPSWSGSQAVPCSTNWSGSQTFPPSSPWSGNQEGVNQDNWLSAGTITNQTTLQQSFSPLASLPSPIPWSSPPSLPSWIGPADRCTWGTLPALVTMCPSCHAWGLMTPK